MVGILVRHEQYGEGRVVAKHAGSLRVVFFGKSGEVAEQEFGMDALKRGFLRRFLLEKGRPCRAAEGPCVIEQVLSDGQAALRSYQIHYDNGVGAVCTEAELEPLSASGTQRPSARLAERDLDHLLSFRCREALRGAQLQNLRQGGHLMALLSARIDLHPHQAFVAGTVLDDRRRRYILADEVGLGKTIEAGVIIHDLLSGKPIELIERALLNSSKTGDIVADLFGGSGSTLIACERRARLMEIDPKYADCIVHRFQVYSGKSAVLDGDGRPFEAIAGERKGEVA